MANTIKKTNTLFNIISNNNTDVGNVKNNKIEQIPDTICFLKKLMKLDISNNNITELHIVLRKL